MPEVDRVLGGGFVPGGAVLLAGEPGIGKSTLVLQLLDSIGRSGKRCLLVTGEESLDQVALRATRLGADASAFLAAAGTSLSKIIAASESERPDLLVVDSIQTLHDPALDQAPGSVTQVRECASLLVRHAKQTGTAVVMVGHVTKDGNVAGPKTLEHVVDVVLQLEGERSGSLRLLRAEKNRFGSCEETGVFTMEGEGLAAVADPSAMLLADRCLGVPGSVVFPSLEGTRPVLIEAQALVTKAPAPTVARRVPIGMDGRRLALLLGVLAERADLQLGAYDIFVAAAGGMAVKEPAADLAFALALCSAARQKAIPAGVVAFGEVGLGGEIRRVPGAQRRLAEAARLGFEVAVVPKGMSKVPGSLRCIEVEHLAEAAARVATAPLRPVAATSSGSR